MKKGFQFMNHEIVIIIFTSPGGGEFLASSSEFF